MRMIFTNFVVVLMMIIQVSIHLCVRASIHIGMNHSSFCIIIIPSILDHDHSTHADGEAEGETHTDHSDHDHSAPLAGEEPWDEGDHSDHDHEDGHNDHSSKDSATVIMSLAHQDNINLCALSIGAILLVNLLL